MQNILLFVGKIQTNVNKKNMYTIGLLKTFLTQLKSRSLTIKIGV